MLNEQINVYKLIMLYIFFLLLNPGEKDAGWS